ncbi:uncharacterized protein PHACADRAFT_207388 [Phanerochaete carnosa HHB-10118-sp]|uniref:Uncharacterized protein n=1 Tax=Phanerochaete carnosa (strain HHB-10118-sp) TaxID=650164 RepID=K5W3V3_PHACS|nr:uncharacterized protein PHACADRAFT_207388 [Phanerochaete carnosa HHB-10118-sp]EKM58568.1 hypothetical protein PHACADRAFT_207388 [Phanerochaete carnosa HHB-10118-sp]
MGDTLEEQIKRFGDAYISLATDTKRQPKEAQDILAILQVEFEAVNEAVRLRRDPSIVHHVIPDPSFQLARIMATRSANPGYLGISKINFDHFGQDARTAYNAGHTYALMAAAAGNLMGAYTLNAFADHFLEDLFSAGHLRTPRRMLHADYDIAPDYCAKACTRPLLALMQPSGETWTAYGDKRALDAVNKENLERCLAAVQASADEIYAAYLTRQVPNPVDFRAWNHAPTLDLRRLDIENRRQAQFTSDWWFDTTAVSIKSSSWWGYPMSLDGPRKIIPWTGISACNTGGLQNTMVFYQDSAGGIHQSRFVDGVWYGGPTAPALLTAASFSALASVSWDGGNGASLFWVEPGTYVVHERRYASGQWTAGPLGSLDVKVDWYASMAAVSWATGGTRFVRLYLQERGAAMIQELAFDTTRGWSRASQFQNVMRGTGLAAAAFLNADGTALSQIHVFHQTPEATIRDCYWDYNTSIWSMNPLVQIMDAAPATCISAATWPGGGSNITTIFYSDTQDTLCQRVSGDWNSTRKIVAPPLLSTMVAAVQANNDQSLPAANGLDLFLPSLDEHTARMRSSPS